MSESKRLEPGTNVSLAPVSFVNGGARAHNRNVLSTGNDYMPPQPVPWVVRGSPLVDMDCPARISLPKEADYLSWSCFNV